MGGLMSLYGVTAHNETFSRAACLSPSVRFSFTEVKADIKTESNLRGGAEYRRHLAGVLTKRAVCRLEG